MMIGRATDTTTRFSVCAPSSRSGYDRAPLAKAASCATRVRADAHQSVRANQAGARALKRQANGSAHRAARRIDMDARRREGKAARAERKAARSRV